MTYEGDTEEKPKKRGGRKKGSKNKPKQQEEMKEGKEGGYDPFQQVRSNQGFTFPNVPMNLELSKPIKLGGLRGQF